VRNALLTFLITWILCISFIALLIVAAFYSIVGLEESNSVILRYALNISNIKINSFDSTISLITFITICN